MTTQQIARAAAMGLIQQSSHITRKDALREMKTGNPVIRHDGTTQLIMAMKPDGKILAMQPGSSTWKSCNPVFAGLAGREQDGISFHRCEVEAEDEDEGDD